MVNIDLIPASYRASVALKRFLRTLGLCMLSLLLVGMVLYAILQWQLKQETLRRDDLLRGAGEISAIQKEVDALAARKALLQKTAEVIGLLRGPGDITTIAQALDRSLNAGVWLADLRFARDYQLLDAAKAKAATPDGAVAIEYAPVAAGQARQTWHFTRNIELRGIARDNAAMTDFIGVLGNQAGIGDVRFLNSVLSAGNEAKLVEFNATARVKHPARATQ